MPARPEEEALDPQRPSPGLLIAAYERGIFPMADPESGEIGWYSPDPRAILPLDGFHVPRGLARVVRQDRFEISTDADFEGVMRACGPGGRDETDTWIDERLIDAYVGLHEQGQAHSVEARLQPGPGGGGELVGGLYGVQLGGGFFGESMFVRPDLGGTDASKVCLVYLVRHLAARGFTLLDTQFMNEHLVQFGCREIPRAEYLERLGHALRLDVTWGSERIWTTPGG